MFAAYWVMSKLLVKFGIDVGMIFVGVSIGFGAVGIGLAGIMISSIVKVEHAAKINPKKINKPCFFVNLADERFVSLATSFKGLTSNSFANPIGTTLPPHQEHGLSGGNPLQFKHSIFLHLIQRTPLYNELESMTVISGVAPQRLHLISSDDNLLLI